MKAVLISIQPKWCELIASGKKTVEVRKTAPKEVPFKAYIYCTAIKDKKYYTDEFDIPVETGKWKGNSHIVGEFICDWVTEINPHCDINGCVNQYVHGYPAILGESDCLSFEEMKSYLGNKKGYAWHISELKIYDEPKELIFNKPCPIKWRNCPVCEFYSSYTGCCCNQVKRSPQSWCYVEDTIYE